MSVELLEISQHQLRENMTITNYSAPSDLDKDLMMAYLNRDEGISSESIRGINDDINEAMKAIKKKNYGLNNI